MITDKFALEKYVIKKRFPATYIISGDYKEIAFYAVKTIGRNQISIFDRQSLSAALLKIDWKVKKGLTLNTYKFNIVDRAHTPLGKVECERTPVFSTTFTIKDVYDREIGVIQPDQVGYAYKYFNVIIKGKNAAAFYKNAHVGASYIMDLSGDKDKALDRKLAVAIAVILVAIGIPMQKFTSSVDWAKPVIVGDELYKIKRRS
ncbi:MAG: hypothetical protein JW869_06195 [Candidatus Omnitrophica bacterium]|nr:hypothetical protein [Candidatus Omnitrophota bacterium]